MALMIPHVQSRREKAGVELGSECEGVARDECIYCGLGAMRKVFNREVREGDAKDAKKSFHHGGTENEETKTPTPGEVRESEDNEVREKKLSQPRCRGTEKYGRISSRSLR
jgi:hypothetical protein